MSIRSGLVSIDSHGRKFTGGEFVRDTKTGKLTGIKWTHKNPSNKWIGDYDGDKVTVRQTLITDQPEMASYYYGHHQEGTSVYVKKNQMCLR